TRREGAPVDPRGWATGMARERERATGVEGNLRTRNLRSPTRQSRTRRSPNPSLTRLTRRIRLHFQGAQGWDGLPTFLRVLRHRSCGCAGHGVTSVPTVPGSDRAPPWGRRSGIRPRAAPRPVVGPAAPRSGPACEPIRITAAVVAFVVVRDGSGPRPQPLHEWARDAGPIGRMSLDGLPFAVVELPRLVQDVRADLELADVVEEGSPPELVTVLLPELQFLSQKIGEDADPFRVPARPAIVRLERRGQREDGGGAFGFLRGRGVGLKLREPVRKALHAPDLARHGEARGGPVREQHEQLEQ